MTDWLRVNTNAQLWLTLIVAVGVIVFGLIRDEFEVMSLGAALLGGPGAIRFLRGQPERATEAA